MDGIKVSIWMLAYNHSEFIEQAIEGIINQKCNFQFELIIHDDASTDGTTKIIEKYAKLYPDTIKTIFEETNQFGKKKFFPMFINIAKGEYLAMCEGDDAWIDLYKLQKQVDFLDNHPDYEAVYSKCKIVDENGVDVSYLRPIYNRFSNYRFTLFDYAKGYFPGQTASILSRNTFSRLTKDQLNAYYGLETTGDTKRILVSSLFGDIFCMEDVMTLHRVVQNQGSSWSAKNKDKNLSGVMFRTTCMEREYTKRFFSIHFPNSYLSLHCLCAVILKYLKNRNDTNVDALHEVLTYCGGCFEIIKALCKLSIVSIYDYFYIFKRDRKST